MAFNPSSSSNPVSPHNGGTYSYDSQNEVTGSNRQPHNNFGFGRRALISPRFAEITPFEVVQCVPDDYHTFGSSIDLRTYTMRSPQFARLTAHKDYYHVPLSAILPNSWELWYKNPQKGDDVPENCYCNFLMYPYFWFNSIYNKLVTVADGDRSLSTVNARDCLNVLYYLSALYNCFSSGSLPVQVGLPFHRLFRYFDDKGNEYFIDDWFDVFFANKSCKIYFFPLSYVPDVSPSSADLRYASHGFDLSTPAGFRDFMQFAFGNFGLSPEQDFVNLYSCVYFVSSAHDVNTNLVVKSLDFSSRDVSNFVYTLFENVPIFTNVHPQTSESVDTSAVYIIQYKDGFNLSSPIPNSSCQNAYQLDNVLGNYDNMPYDISPLIAYHQAVSQFFTVDAIDNVFDSKSWMQNMESLATFSFKDDVDNSLSYFSYNGRYVRYDVFSTSFLCRVFSVDTTAVGDFLSWEYKRRDNGYMRAFLYNLMSYGRSLLYGDYFTGARLEPLSVGDVTVDVNPDAGVNVVDIAQKDWKARFLNFVNRIGNQITDYIYGLSGVKPQQIDPLPKIVVHQELPIQSYEVENQTFNPDATNSEQLQGYSVSLMRAGGNGPVMTIGVTEPSVLIGLLSFEMRRFYDGVTDRQMFVKNRFDIFNAYLQNIGDQSIYSAEASPFKNTVDIEDPIGYQLRDTHYKQRVDVARGAFSKGFVNLLPSWARVVSMDDFVLDSEHIRNSNADFDDFYMILSGLSLRSYFHFICMVTNYDDASRPMQAKPMLKL